MQKDKIWFNHIDFNSQSKLEKSDFKILQQVLYDSLENKKFNPKKLVIEDHTPRILFLSVAPKNITATVFCEGRVGLLNAIEVLFTRFLENFTDHNVDDLIIKLDIVTNVTEIKNCTADTRYPLERGLQGIAFAAEYNLAILPEQIAYNFLLDDNLELYLKRTYNYLENNPLEASKFFEVLNSKKFTVYLFATEGFLVEKKQLQLLYRGQKLYDKLDIQDIKHAIQLAAGYLNGAVYSSGRFDYSYYADANRSMKDYSALRHAGTIFSMAEYYDVFRDDSILFAIKKAMSYMMRFFVPGIEDANTICLLERGSIKLGGNGLAILAIAKYTEATNDTSYIPFLKKASEWILKQMREDGSFPGHIQYYPKGNYKDMISEYYPGEAIYGLMLANKISPDERFVEASYKIAKWLINTRDGNKSVRELQHDHWLLYGLNELHRAKQDQQFIEHVAKICNAIMNKQNLLVKYPDYFGSFYSGDPRSTPAATRSEGLLAAYRLIRDYGDNTQLALSIMECAKRTVGFQLRTQYTELTTMYLAVREKAYGGFRSSINTHEIRIDYVQHNLSSLLALYQIMMEDEQKYKKVFYKKNTEKFEFMFAGDTSFGENYQERIKQMGGESILERFGYEYGLEKFKSIMTGADFVVMNLETPITDCKNSPFEGEKDYIHWTDKEKAPETLIEHNVSLVSLANNHSFDYGPEGYDQTLSILKEYSVPVIGAGDNIHQASQPFIIEINFEDKKTTIAIIAAFEDVPSYRNKYKVYADANKPGLMPLDLEIIAVQVQKIKALDPNALVVLFPHWGNNYQWRNKKQINVTDDLFAIGVDLIIGHGAHMIQEFEKRNGKLVLYSIGNFMFNSPGRYEKMQAPPYSAVASLTVEIVNDQPDIQLKLYPIVSDNKITNYQPRFINKSELNDLSKLLLEKESMVDFKYLLEAKQDQFGYYFQVPVMQNDIRKQDVGQKWIGLMYHDYHNTKTSNGKFNIIMYRASVLAPQLAKDGYKLICYSPINVNKEEKTVTGYVLENNKFKQICVAIPKVNYDFHIGPDDFHAYREFQVWALEYKCNIYPTKPIKKLAQDKLLAAQIVSKFNNSIIPYTEVFDSNIDQLKKYLLKTPTVFIKPRYGSKGDKILVVKSKNSEFVVEYYMKAKKQIFSFLTIAQCLSYINNMVNNEKYIIQEAIDVVTYEGSVFDIRVLVFNEGPKWHFLSEVRVGAKLSELSNIAQGGYTDISIEFLEKIFSKEKASRIMEKIKETTVNLTVFLSKEYNELINELAFDIIIDKSKNIYLAEINTKPGLAGLTKYDDFFNMTDYEKNFYEKLSVKHGYYLAKSLIYKDI